MQLLESPIPPLTAAALRRTICIICKTLVPPDGQSLQINICKRPVSCDHHLREADPSGSLFARGRSLRIIIYKRLAPHFDNHEKGMKNAFLRPFTM